jgi:hypothetical protein
MKKKLERRRSPGECALPDQQRVRHPRAAIGMSPKHSPAPGPPGARSSGAGLADARLWAIPQVGGRRRRAAADCFQRRRLLPVGSELAIRSILLLAARRLAAQLCPRRGPRRVLDRSPPPSESATNTERFATTLRGWPRTRARRLAFCPSLVSRAARGAFRSCRARGDHPT